MAFTGLVSFGALPRCSQNNIHCVGKFHSKNDRFLHFSGHANHFAVIFSTTAGKKVQIPKSAVLNVLTGGCFPLTLPPHVKEP